MTDPVSLATGLTAAVLAGWAGWLSVPSPPDLSAERWFKTLVANVLLGSMEAAGASGEAWAEAVRVAVPFDGGEGTRWSLTEDPALLGALYDPAHWLGAAGSWEAVALWDGVPDALARVDGATWVLVRASHGAATPLVDALREELGTRALTQHLVEENGPAAAGEQLAKSLLTTQGRLVLVVEGLAAVAVVHALVGQAELRDRVIAVVSVGGWPQGLPEAEGEWGDLAVRPWLARHFNHRSLDTEAVGRTPWFSLRAVEQPRGELACFPEVEDDRGDPWGVDTLDLGVASTDAAYVQAVARGLWVMITCWTTSRMA